MTGHGESVVVTEAGIGPAVVATATAYLGSVDELPIRSPPSPT